MTTMEELLEAGTTPRQKQMLALLHLSSDAGMLETELQVVGNLEEVALFQSQIVRFTEKARWFADNDKVRMEIPLPEGAAFLELMVTLSSIYEPEEPDEGQAVPA